MKIDEAFLRRQADREAETARMAADLAEGRRKNPRPNLPYAPMDWDLSGEPRDFYQETDYISERRNGNV